MKNLYYNILDFDWDKANNLFTVTESNLYPIFDKNYLFCFPSQGKQFFIHNMNTKNSVRFRLQKQNNEYYFYESELSITCKIKKIKDA